MSALPQDQVGLAMANILARDEEGVLTEWMQEIALATRRADLIKESEFRNQCSQFLSLMRQALQTGGHNFKSPAWDSVRNMLNDISRSRAQLGFTSMETATFATL